MLKRPIELAHQHRARADLLHSVLMNPHLFDDITAKVRSLLEQSPAADLEKNLRALLAGFFNRLDLVTREEYDVQRDVLLRTREKLTALEAKVAELERKQQRPTG